jgi:hypothetical protein
MSQTEVGAQYLVWWCCFLQVLWSFFGVLSGTFLGGFSTTFRRLFGQLLDTGWPNFLASFCPDFGQFLVSFLPSFWPLFGHFLATFWLPFGQLLASFCSRPGCTRDINKFTLHNDATVRFEPISFFVIAVIFGLAFLPVFLPVFWPVGGNFWAAFWPTFGQLLASFLGSFLARFCPDFG